MSSKGNLRQRLSRAIDERSLEMLKDCAYALPTIDYADDYGDTPLMEACLVGYLTAVEWLVERGADVDARNSEHGGVTPLWYSLNPRDYARPADKPYAQLVATLVQHGADPEGVDDLGMTPLIAAASQGLSDAVAQLLRYKVDIDHATKNDETALTYAIVWGHVDVAKLLIDAGADVNWRSKNGASPLTYATERLYFTEDRRDREVTALLLEHGADADQRYELGGNILLRAIRSLDEENVLAVLHRANDINFRDDLGFTALGLAKQHGMDRAVAELEARGALE